MRIGPLDPYWVAQMLALAFAVGPASAHDPYTGWLVPGSTTSPCCSGKDCRPTRAYLGEDQHWHAWTGKGWVAVPDDRVLPPDYAGDGRSHLCEQEGYVYCFTAGQVRY